MAARDILVITIILFVVGILLFVSSKITKQMNNAFLDIEEINATAGEEIRSVNNVVNMYDYLFFAFFIGFFMAIIITGWFIGGNPFFMAIYFFIVVFLVMLAAIVSYVWDNFAQTPSFATTLLSFPITNHILNHFAVYIAIISLAGLLVMFGKPYFTNEQI